MAQSGAPGHRPQRVLAVISRGFSSRIVASFLTALVFVGLHRVGAVGDLPLPVLLAILAVAATASTLASRAARRDTSDRAMTGIVGVHVLAATAVIYSIGWGPALGIGYPFTLARDMEDMGSRVWCAGVVWCAVGIGLGQVAIATGLFPSYL